MRRVKQGDPTGCGFACIAMLSGASYDEIKNIAITDLDYEGSGDFYTGTRELRYLASKNNVELGKRRRTFKSLDALPETAILAINHEDKLDTWHWVVYCRKPNEEYVYDPKKSIKSNKRTDFGRMKIKWFLPIIT